MVIADNHINALAISVCHFLHRLDTAVQCDNQSAPLLRSIIYSLLRNTVTLGITIRNIIIYYILALGSLVLNLLIQEPIHQCHRSRAIHIVIAVDKNFLALRYGFM